MDVCSAHASFILRRAPNVYQYLYVGEIAFSGLITFGPELKPAVPPHSTRVSSASAPPLKSIRPSLGIPALVRLMLKVQLMTNYFQELQRELRVAWKGDASHMRHRFVLLLREKGPPSSCKGLTWQGPSSD